MKFFFNSKRNNQKNNNLLKLPLSSLTLFTLLMILYHQPSLAQINNTRGQNKSNKIQSGTGSISGRTLNKSDKSPIISAKVMLLFAKDSSIVTGTFSKPNGEFLINKVPQGRFLLKVSSIGYSDYTSKIFSIADGENLNLKNIEIEQQSVVTEEATVVAQRQTVQVTAEGKIVNVADNALATGGSAIDVLQNTPSVSVDFDGNISLRGSSSVNVLIDGQQIATSGDSRTALLDNIPASAIESIEIINNPGAKYSPEGMGGVLNIKLKKKQNLGFNGLLGLNIGTRDKYNGSLNLNWGLGDFNTFFSNDFRLDNRRFEGTTSRENTIIDTSAYLWQDMIGARDNLSNNTRVGFDWLINDQNTLTTSFNYNFSDSKNPETLNSNEYGKGNTLSFDPNLLTYRDISNSVGTWKNNSFFVMSNYTKKMDTPREVFSVDFNYSNNNSNRLSDRTTFSPTTLDSTYLNTTTEDKSTNLVFNGNYTLPFSGKSKLDLGWNSNFRNTNSIYTYSTDLNNNNDFTYKENIYAAYGSFNDNIGNFDYSLGLRGETANINLYQAQKDTSFDINYISFFPTLGLKYNFTQTNALNFNYSRRINRPNMWNLNPYVSIDNPRLVRSGNPDVKPEYVDALELGWSSFFEKRSIIASVYFRNINNAIRRYSYMDSSGVTHSSFSNFDNSQFTGIEFIEEENLADWWKTTTTLSFYHNVINGKKELGIFGNQNNSWNLKINSTMNLWWGVDMQFYLSYASPVATAQGEIKQFYNIDVAFKKDITDDLTVTLKMSDIFNTLNFSVYSEGIGYTSDIYRKRETRTGFLNITYKINSGIKPKKERQRTNSDDGGAGDMDF